MVWSKPPESLVIGPNLPAGGWDDASNADQIVMEKLSSQHRDFLANANKLLMVDDPPIICIGPQWKLMLREDSWILLAPYLTREALDAFHKIALEVLSEDDPQYELRPEESWAASIHKKVLKHSLQLRVGPIDVLKKIYNVGN